MARIFVVYATVEGQSRLIAHHVVETLQAAGHAPMHCSVGDAAAADLSAADAVLVAGSIHVGRHSPELAQWVEASRAVLTRVPTAFLSVSMSAARPADRPQAERYVVDFLAQAGWRPTLSATVAGALRYPEYGVLKRWLIRRIAASNGLPTDTTRVHELTDWQAVTELTLRFAEGLPAAAPV